MPRSRPSARLDSPSCFSIRFDAAAPGPFSHSPTRSRARRCAATFVNDAFGPDRASRPGQRQNVKFVCLKDGSGFPHIFWKCIRAVPKGGALWGDYGDDFWEHKQDDDPIFAAMLRRMLYTVRGCSAAFPIPLDVEA